MPADRIELRPKAFDVLRDLVENRARVIGKDELIQAVWQGQAVTDDALVQCVRIGGGMPVVRTPTWFNHLEFDWHVQFRGAPDEPAWLQFIAEIEAFLQEG